MPVDSRYIFLIWKIHFCDSSGGFRNVFVEKSREDSHGFCGILHDHDIQEPMEYSDSWCTLFSGSQDGSDILFPFRLCFLRFQQCLHRIGAQKIMIDNNDSDIPGFGSTFSYFSPICKSVSATCVSVQAESASVTSVCHVLTHSETGSACLWLQLWFPGPASKLWWEMPQPHWFPG